jgi:cytochrome c-type protein NapB
MNKPNYESHKKGSWIVGVVLMTIAVSGYFMGLRQTGSALRTPQPVSAITPDSVRRSAEETNRVPVAVAYGKQDWLRKGRNARWTNSVANLVQPVVHMSSLTNISEADRELALWDRSARRAYNGAPPVVPHPIQEDSSAACLACHGEGLAVKNRFASRISHPHYANCTQCHVPAGGPRIPITETALNQPLAFNSFVGAKDSLKGSRAWLTAPPTIPHSTHMRSDCLSCHGPSGLFGLRTPHPERQSCTQCHAPNADLDRRRFLATLQPERE